MTVPIPTNNIVNNITGGIFSNIQQVLAQLFQGQPQQQQPQPQQQQQLTQ